MPRIEQQYAYIELPNAVFILHTREPLIIGRVWLYKNMQELTMQMEKVKALGVIYFDTHSIAISVWTVLGDRLVFHDATTDEIKATLSGMKEFFIETRVKKSPKYYDKFLL